MKDLRKVKEELLPQTTGGVKVFTDHIPTRFEAIWMRIKKFIANKYIHIIVILSILLLMTYPNTIGQFMGSWWNNFSTSFVKECIK